MTTHFVWGGLRHWVMGAGILALVVAAAGCDMTQYELQPRKWDVEFKADQVGQVPPDFQTALTGGGGPVRWVVREDATAPGNYVLAQESADQTSYRFPLCIYQNYLGRDVIAEVQYKAISGSVDQAGGIVLRYAPENYYIARANALENNIDLFKTVDGKRLKIVEVPCKVTPNQWHTLRFAAVGTHLAVWFDGRQVISADDTSFVRPGKVGLWTKADSVSEFADLRIEPVK